MNKGKWLDDLLITKGWKSADLAHATGLDSAVISNIRNGRRRAGPETARKIAEALELPTQEVFRKAGLLDEPNDDEFEMFRREIKAMNDDEKQQALNVLKALNKVFRKK